MPSHAKLRESLINLAQTSPDVTVKTLAELTATLARKLEALEERLEAESRYARQLENQVVQLESSLATLSEPEA